MSKMSVSFLKEILIALPIVLIVTIIASQLVVVPTESMKPTINDEVEFKSMIFVSTLGQINNVLVIISEYKKGNFKIYPETITFKFIKIIPISILKNIQ